MSRQFSLQTMRAVSTNLRKSSSRLYLGLSPN